MILAKILLNAAALYFSAWIAPGIYIKDFWTAIIAAIVLGLLNTFIRPILDFFSFPITFLTLGLFTLVINTLIIMLCSYFVSSFHINGFLFAFIFSIIYSIASWIINSIFGID